MKRNRKKALTALLVIILAFSIQAVAFAANTWSDPGTFVLNRSQTWVRITTGGIYLCNTKTTIVPDVTVSTLAKTMSTRPHSQFEQRGKMQSVYNGCYR